MELLLFVYLPTSLNESTSDAFDQSFPSSPASHLLVRESDAITLSLPHVPDCSHTDGSGLAHSNHDNHSYSTQVNERWLNTKHIVLACRNNPLPRSGSALFSMTGNDQSHWLAATLPSPNEWPAFMFRGLLALSEQLDLSHERSNMCRSLSGTHGKGLS